MGGVFERGILRIYVCVYMWIYICIQIFTAHHMVWVYIYTGIAEKQWRGCEYVYRCYRERVVMV